MGFLSVLSLLSAIFITNASCVPNPGRDTQVALPGATPDYELELKPVVPGGKRSKDVPSPHCLSLASYVIPENLFHYGQHEVYPAAMHLLSYVAIAMSFYNLMLKFKGFCWTTWASLLTKTVALGDGLFGELKIQSAIPSPKPRKPPDKRHHVGRRRRQGRSHLNKRLLAAFALCSQMGAGAGLELCSEVQARKELRKHRAYTGMLNTNSLDPATLIQLRATLSLNAESFHQEANHNAVGALFAIVDTGCSCSCSNSKGDFEPGSLVELDKPKSLGGIAGDLKVEHEGILCWETLNDYGEVVQFRTKGYYIPELPARLFSPQSFLMENQRLDDHFRVWHNRSEWWVGNKKVLTLPYDPSTFLPRLTLFQKGTGQKVLQAMAGIVTQETNQNLTPIRKLWLKFHFALGHLGFEHVRWLAIHGALGPQATKIRQDDPSCPKCAACHLGKQTRRPTSSKRVTRNPDSVGALKRDKLDPGQLVFMDQLESRVRGRRMHTKGGEREVEKFCGSTVFCDAASHYISVQHQVNLTAAETLKAKAMFEREAQGHGVKVQSYHADNGIFTARDFVGEFMKQEQGSDLEGTKSRLSKPSFRYS